MHTHTHFPLTFHTIIDTWPHNYPIRQLHHLGQVYLSMIPSILLKTNVDRSVQPSTVFEQTYPIRKVYACGSSVHRSQVHSISYVEQQSSTVSGRLTRSGRYAPPRSSEVYECAQTTGEHTIRLENCALFHA
jgi:hypothetical protein